MLSSWDAHRFWDLASSSKNTIVCADFRRLWEVIPFVKTMLWEIHVFFFSSFLASFNWWKLSIVCAWTQVHAGLYRCLLVYEWSLVQVPAGLWITAPSMKALCRFLRPPSRFWALYAATVVLSQLYSTPQFPSYLWKLSIWNCSMYYSC